MKFHHLGIAVKSIGTALPFYKNLFGYELFSGPSDDPIQRVSVCFLRHPQECMVIELVAPLSGETPIDRILGKGGGPYHTCYEVPDLDQTIARMSSQECFLVSPPAPAAAFHNRRIAWLMTPARHLIELLEGDH